VGAAYAAELLFHIKAFIRDALAPTVQKKNSPWKASTASRAMIV